MTAPPVSTLRGMEHVASTVPDIEQAVRFFVDVLGCEHLYDIGPFEDPEGDWFAVNLDLDPRARIPRGALPRCGHGSNFEIFEYEAPGQVQRMPRMSDWGGVHLAFAHFLSPWGMLLELVSFPRGKAYMHGRTRLLWTPVHPSA